MSRPLRPRDLEGPVQEVAPALLGTLLKRRLPTGEVLVARIVEVEAYGGPEDAASHARFGPQGRAGPMFGPPGRAYVYLVYGMHHCLNVVTGPRARAAAVLLRALEPVEGVEARLDGPGRLAKAFHIDRSQSGRRLTPAEGLWLERPPPAPARPVAEGPRIGIDYAPEPWRSLPWRFTLADSECLSR